MPSCLEGITLRAGFPKKHFERATLEMGEDPKVYGTFYSLLYIPKHNNMYSEYFDFSAWMCRPPRFFSSRVMSCECLHPLIFSWTALRFLRGTWSSSRKIFRAVKRGVSDPVNWILFLLHQCSRISSTPTM